MLQNIERCRSVILRAAALGCTFILAALSLLPAGAMTRTAFGGPAEHFVAYMGTALAIGVAFQKPHLGVQFGLLMTYAAFLEVGQLFSPGRYASFRDLAFSAAGVAMGELLVWVGRRRMSNWRRPSELR